MARRPQVPVIAAIFGVITLAVHAQPRPADQDRVSRPVRLRAATFTPTRGESPEIRASMMRGDDNEGVEEYIVQFEGPVLEAWKVSLQGAGAELHDYIPDFAFKVRMNRASAGQVRRLPFVTWVGAYHPAYKLGPELARDRRRAFVVRLARGANRAEAEAALAAAGIQRLWANDSLLVLSADAAELDAIAHVRGIESVENFVLRRKHGEFAGAIIGSSLANANGFDGSTQTIAIADTGLGNGAAGNAHVDLPASRISAIANWPGAPDFCFETIVNDGAADVDTGHGTHVATIALGNGDVTGAGRGAAPGAQLMFQSVENWAVPSLICSLFYGIPEGYYLVGIPADLGQLFQQGYDAGARVHSDSWGSDVAGAYTADSANTDAFVWSHRDLAITISAGNSGIDNDDDGVVDEGSINSPGTAKNVITVGASENDRQSHWDCDQSLTYTSCAADGGQNSIFTYGAAWPDRFAVNPLRDDPSAGNAEQLAAFSSRGPTTDGRIKPDVVAPGTWMLAGYSDRYQQQYDPSPNPQNGFYQYDGWGFPANLAYKYMGGTSMSAPLVAGAAAVVRDYYQKTYEHQASAALVKATLINSAVDLLDENNDGAFDNAHPIPNVHEGWGRIDLGKATDGSHLFSDESAPLSTGSSALFSFPIGASGSPFKVTLVWTDYPSTPTAGVNLVNDLDLTLVAPDGTTYRGNTFAGGWSLAGGQADRINNVENVYVLSAAAGTWSVIVQGYNVPNGPQPFALVMDSVPEAPGSRPVVRAFATDATATEAGSTSGAILVTRSGDTALPLTVNYTVGGTATPGSDYVALTGSVTIPEGRSEITVSVAVNDDSNVESDETVVVTLDAGTDYDIGSPASAVVTIVSNDLPPDLAVTSLTPPGPSAAGSAVNVIDTTMNKGTSPTQASQTGFYLSTNGSLDATDVFLGSRQVSALAAGASEARSTTLTIPAATASGTYYMLAKADWSGEIPETVETNNLRASAAFRVGPDVVVSQVSAPATGAAGETLVVTETTLNQGADTAASSVTAFYLSTNASWDVADVLLGSRPVPQLAPTASHQAVTTVTLPLATAAGTYYVVAKADVNASVGESLEDNNVRASAAVKIGADLLVSAVSAPAAAGSGDTVVVTDTTKNQGGADSPASNTFFYLSVNAQMDAADVLLGLRAVPALDAGVSSTGGVALTIPESTPPGSYYILAKADADSGVVETSESNNVKATSVFRVGPDLTVHALTTPTLGEAGETMSVTVTVKNIGGGSASATMAAFSLSLNTTVDAGDVALGEWSVPSLAAGAAESATLSLVIPESTATGNYYILATADSANGLAEVYENNNTRSSALLRVGPDLTVTVLNGPASARAGTAIVMTDTTKNQGGGAAPGSSTSFYLSTNGTLDAGDVLLGTRVVGALAANASASGPATLPIPQTTAPGTYYVIAKADGSGDIAETVETNNTRAKSLRIDPP